MKEVYYCKLYYCTAAEILRAPQIHLFGTTFCGKNVPGQDKSNRLLNTWVPFTFKRTGAGILSLRKLTVWTSAIRMTLLKCHIITPANNWWCVLSWLEKINKTTRLRRDLFFVLVRGEIWKAGQRIQANLCSETLTQKRGKGCEDKEIFVFPTCRGRWDVALHSTQQALLLHSGSTQTNVSISV